jgi:catechol 2,3-dioxygenase-like lactoylglutathione lyase family enzyme
MRFVNPIVFATDIAASKAFYADVIGLGVEEDHGDFVLFSERFALHAGTALIRTVWGSEHKAEPSPFGRGNLLLCFEDIHACFSRLKDRVRLIHPVRRQA